MQLVQALLFAPNNLLVHLDKGGNVETVVTLQGLFGYVLGEHK